MSIKSPTLERAFATLVKAALEGRRCPVRGVDGITSDLVCALAREGRVLVTVYGRNYRVVKILTGPHAGKTTAPNPRGGEPWQTIGTTTTVHGQPVDHGAARRFSATKRLRTAASEQLQRLREHQRPSAPRPLTQSKLDE